MAWYYALIISLSLLGTPSQSAPQQRPERAFATPDHIQQSKHIPIIHMELKNDAPDGGYRFAYQTGNQIASEETGDGTKAQGSYAYVAPDGQRVSMTYVADADGFHPQGSHLPIPPPMPEAIRRAVERNLEEEARGLVDDGQYRNDETALPALPLRYRV